MTLVRHCLCSLLVLLTFTSASLAASEPPTSLLLENVRVFDGKSSRVSGPTNVLIVGPVIKSISSAPIGNVEAEGNVTRIDGGGRVLMPGLIDAHWHSMFLATTPLVGLMSDVGYLNLLAAAQAKATLLRGFTTVRDMGGPAFSLKQAIDEGVAIGPRIYPSGAMISVTSGHGDFRQMYEIPRTIGGPPSRMEQIGASAIADTPDEVRIRVREQLMQGASQIKLTAGGGVASPHSPLDVSTFTLPELRAAVEAAENWGTYVAVHAYTPRAIRTALDAGVKCIDHGHLADEATAKLMAEKSVWWSLQPFLNEGPSQFPEGSQEAAKKKEVAEGTDRAYALAKKYKIKTAWGTDILFSPQLTQRQNAMLTVMTRWYTPAEVLIMATSTNAQLLAMSGKRNPYPGKLGVVEEGALADLLLVDGNPLENIHLIDDPAKNLVVIIKNGAIAKNSLMPASRTSP
ncbi:metal-dependent hydrolase family protein [Peristeroidobacter soli]|uniref:metal-dependent hydrolase family protein n=1 Tax=Peristeroidobacter soli TaxID=2497877 RepID=UPI00101DCD1D